MTHPSPRYPVPVIGLTGGIASGKSAYARLLADLGCTVISADNIVADLYRQPAILQTLAGWWPSPPHPPVLHPDGSLHRHAVAQIVFADPDQRRRLESLIHPLVTAERERRMTALTGTEAAVVWDVPLLLETDMHPLCDVVAFVDTPDPVRIARVAQRGWSPQDLAARESAQWPLDRKRAAAHLTLDGTADPEIARLAAAHLLHLARQKFAANASKSPP